MQFEVSYKRPTKKQEIITGDGVALSRLETLKEENPKKSFLIICDKNIKTNQIANDIIKLYNHRVLYVETNNKKDFESVLDLIRAFKRSQLSRTSIVICIGGGTLGDICGFASSIYMRGIDYVQVSTTLMSQLDGIVEKVAVCDSSFKNICGSFYSPIININDTGFLCSRVDKLSYIEAIKHYLISFKCYDDLLVAMNLIQNNRQEDLACIIHESIKIKINFVRQDPYDENEMQKALSLGHTFANVIETIHPQISHACAVWLGIEIALRVSEKIYKLDDRLLELLKETRRGLDLNLPMITLQERDVLKLLREDKISENSQINLVLLKKLGDHIVEKEVNYKIIEESILGSEHIEYIKN